MKQSEIDELIRKLSLKDQGSSYIMHPPEDYSLPGTEVLDSLDDVTQIAWIQTFYEHEEDMTRELPPIEDKLDKDGCLWVCWQKHSAAQSNLNDTVVRSIGLACGLVDVKVASINEVWSGLKFVYRKVDR